MNVPAGTGMPPAAAVADDRARRHLAAATRVLDRHGLIGMFGHVSTYPAGDAESFLVSPGAGSRKDRCRPEDVLEVGLDEDWRAGLPLELYMHSEVHRADRRVAALVHTHAPALTTLSTFAQVPGDVLLLWATFWPRRVPVFDDPDLVRDRRAARALACLIDGEALCLLRWHGAVIAGASLEEAVFRTVLAEQNARVLLDGGRREQIAIEGDREAAYRRIVNDRLLSLHFAYEVSYVSIELDVDTGPRSRSGSEGDVGAGAGGDEVER